jgi:hypothetical protein
MVRLRLRLPAGRNSVFARPAPAASAQRVDVLVRPVGDLEGEVAPIEEPPEPRGGRVAPRLGEGVESEIRGAGDAEAGECVFRRRRTPVPGIANTPDRG